MFIIELRDSEVVNVTRDNVSLETSQRKSRLRSKPRTYMDSYFDQRIRSVISPIFPYDFRLSLGVPENGRAEQSGTDLEVAGKSARLGDASIQRFSA